ncbi:MAG TPA: 4-hydroxythreonine-4-phosphate dehydrogenase PdxA [Gemmatimonadales bacterium]|nr:4-hydroxythreonine-4-phosphate dehydrogenase PdxA [Gemmatimonadales bacterium]
MSEVAGEGRPRLAVTLGDPRGIGPELVEAALASSHVRSIADLVVVGPAGSGPAPNEAVGEWSGDREAAAEAGRLAGLAVQRATQMAMAGEVQGIVTAPLDKSALLAGGWTHPGHTEMLAELTGSRVAMMLAATRPSRPGDSLLRVVLATTHLPLRSVPDAVTPEVLESAVLVTREYLVRWFGIPEPRLALCALNPHAGDGGRFGSEDAEVLAPVAARLGVTGPLPADTVFVRALRGEFDAVIAPYHDVGMTAIKVASFGSAVNVTLGLPFPRTSPDHGTALDIAGRGIADPSSFLAAIELGAKLAGREAERARGDGGRP